MNPINELIATYPFSSEKKNPDADFFALLSFVKCQGIKHHFLTFDLNVNPAGYPKSTVRFSIFPAKVHR